MSMDKSMTKIYYKRDRNDSDHHLGWDWNTTKNYFKQNIQEGDSVISVMTTGWGTYATAYRILQVSSITGTRIKLTQPTGHNFKSRSFYYSGKSCYEPMGQTRIIPNDMSSDRFNELFK